MTEGRPFPHSIVDYCLTIYTSFTTGTFCCQIIKTLIDDFQSLKTYVNEQHQARMEKAAAALAKAQAAQPQPQDSSSTKKRGRKRKENGQPADTPTVGPKEAFVFSESTDTGLLRRQYEHGTFRNTPNLF